MLLTPSPYDPINGAQVMAVCFNRIVIISGMVACCLGTALLHLMVRQSQMPLVTMPCVAMPSVPMPLVTVPADSVLPRHGAAPPHSPSITNDHAFGYRAP